MTNYRIERGHQQLTGAGLNEVLKGGKVYIRFVCEGCKVRHTVYLGLFDFLASFNINELIDYMTQMVSKWIIGPPDIPVDICDDCYNTPIKVI